MTTDWLILNVAVANDGETLRYYTFDHRRLRCLYQARCQRIRAQIAMRGRIFDEFVRKADGLGRKVSPGNSRNSGTPGDSGELQGTPGDSREPANQ